MSESLLLRNVRPLGRDAADILIREGRIVAIGAMASADDVPVIDGGGALALPGLIEGHAHIDKTVWGGPWYRNEVGPTRWDRIVNERDWRAQGGHDATARGLGIARQYLANGTTRMRTHADIDHEIGLANVQATMAVRDALAGVMEMQIVAFPQSGILRAPGVAELMDRALAEGADVVGGIDPCQIDRDPVRHLDVIFDLAVKHQRPIDIHLHEPGEMGAFSLDLILERTEAQGLRDMVTVSHGFCLGMIGASERDGLLARMARWGVRIATTAPAASAVPPLAIARAAGVVVYAGNDGIRDTWTPYAKPDMLDRAMFVGLRNALRRDDEIAVALDCVTDSAAVGCGFPEYGLRAGCRGDVVLVRAETVAEAVVAQPVRALVVSSGQVVAREGVLALV